MDAQVGILERNGGTPQVVATLTRAVAAAREHEVLVVFVALAFRSGHPELSERNATFDALGVCSTLPAW